MKIVPRLRMQLTCLYISIPYLCIIYTVYTCIYVYMHDNVMAVVVLVSYLMFEFYLPYSI